MKDVKWLTITLLLVFTLGLATHSEVKWLNQWDYIIVANSQMAGSELTNLRDYIESTRSLRVGMWFFQDGTSNETIKDSIESWYFITPQRIHYVLLVGTARSDGGLSDDIANSNAKNFIPGFYHIDQFGHRTLYDNSYVSFDTSGVGFLHSNTDRCPRLIIGRLPVISRSEVATYQQKLEAYESHRYNDPVSNPDTSWHSDILYVVGDSTRGDENPEPAWVISGMNRIKDEVCPANVDKTYLKMNDYATPASRENALNSLVNNGKTIIVGMATGSNLMNYFDIWTRPSFDVATDLSNSVRLPLFLAASCNTGEADTAYSSGSQRSMAENLLVQSTKGAVAVIGASGFTGQNACESFAAEFLTLYFEHPDWSIGHIFVATKIWGLKNPIEANSIDTYSMFSILGDPSLVLYNDSWPTSDSGFSSAFELDSPFPIQNTRRSTYQINADTVRISVSADPEDAIYDDRSMEIVGTDQAVASVNSSWSLFNFNLPINENNRFLTFWARIPQHPSGIAKLSINGHLANGSLLSDAIGGEYVEDQNGIIIGAANRQEPVWSDDPIFFAFDLSPYDGATLDQLLIEYKGGSTNPPQPFRGYFDNVSISADWGSAPVVDDINMPSVINENTVVIASIYADDFADIYFKRDHLDYEWTASTGYFTGTGAQVQYHAPAGSHVNVLISCHVNDQGGHEVTRTKYVTIQVNSGCPTFYVLSSGRYVKDNVILTESEDNLRDTRDVTDLCPVTVVPDLTDGMIRIKLTEEEKETSYIDHISLLAIPYTLQLGERLALNQTGEVVALTDPIPPFHANSPLGTDLTQAVKEQDGNYFEYYGPGELELFFPNVDSIYSSRGLKKPYGSTPPGVNGPEPPPKNINKVNVTSGDLNSAGDNLVTVEVLDNSRGFVQMNRLFPRIRPTIDCFTELPDLVEYNPMPVVRFTWNDYFRADQIAFYQSRKIDQVDICSDETAASADGASVLNQIEQTDGNYFVLRPGGSIELSFATPRATQQNVQYVLKAVGYYETTSAADQSRTNSADLLQNYPNPFNSTTKISIMVNEPSDVELDIFNILGQKVKSVYSGRLDPGRVDLEWNGTNSSNSEVASGVYYYRLKTNESVQTKKMLYLK